MKSSFSGAQGNCLAVFKFVNGNIIIRETKPITDYDKAVVTTRENFAAFIKGVKNGEFDHFIKE